MKAFGLDGCKGGWFYVCLENTAIECGIVASVADIVARADKEDAICVDIPIGLRDEGSNPRGCDVAARQVLGGGRASSVFNAPLRPALYTPDYPTANALNRSLSGKGLSKQSYNIGNKIREVDELMLASPKARSMVREAHPEVCFWALNDSSAVQASKKTDDGFHARIQLLQKHLEQAPHCVEESLKAHPRSIVARDDIVDAMAVALTAYMSININTLPEYPEVDNNGLPMEITYYAPASHAALHVS
jgi:predicted RNase H-like nuclease